MGGLFTKLFSFLYDLLIYAGNFILNLFIDLVNLVIVAVAGIFSLMLSALPLVSFNFTPPAGLLSVASQINWLIPIGSIFACFSIIAIAYVAYFTIRPVLKFFQLT
ncbi:MAG: hypothetical protein JZU65_23895 [Chlorobium sp.]|nr:hypothetical protein [Chlorobium sp.]